MRHAAEPYGSGAPLVFDIRHVRLESTHCASRPAALGGDTRRRDAGCCGPGGPAGALDAQVRGELREWLRRLHEKIHVTTIFVTHDQEEAMDVAEQIVVVNHGRIEQVGTARELYEHPREFVMSFVGPVNRIGDSFLRPHDSQILADADGTASEALVERIVHLGSRCASSWRSTTGARSGPSSPASAPPSSSSSRGRSLPPGSGRRGCSPAAQKMSVGDERLVLVGVCGGGSRVWLGMAKPGRVTRGWGGVRG
jgi:hypothetical protein